MAAKKKTPKTKRVKPESTTEEATTVSKPKKTSSISFPNRW